MDVDSDTPVVAAANARAHVRGIPADTDQRVRVRPHLRDEDEVALGVSRHRVRVLRLRYFLDQDAVRTDHAERGPTGITSPRWSWTAARDRKSTRLNSSHLVISYAVFCLKKNSSGCRRATRGPARPP